MQISEWNTGGGAIAYSWLVLTVMSIISSGYLIVNEALNFNNVRNKKFATVPLHVFDNQATVSFELKSATESLDQVFFPSVVVCNINALRTSFVYELMEVRIEGFSITCGTHCLGSYLGPFNIC